MGPEIREDMAEAKWQENAASAERRRIAEQLGNAGPTAVSPLQSSITVDRGDYLLQFRNGKLVSWFAH
jgi:hypothetical protein